MSDRKLDALIAEKVLGLEVKHVPAGRFVGDNGTEQEAPEVWWIPGSWLPPYSSNITCAWAVVERFLPQSGWTQEQYEARILFWEAMKEGGRSPLYAWPADKAAMIICRAALKALGIEA